jgi:hypothetical protein
MEYFVRIWKHDGSTSDLPQNHLTICLHTYNILSKQELRDCFKGVQILCTKTLMVIEEWFK